MWSVHRDNRRLDHVGQGNIDCFFHLSKRDLENIVHFPLMTDTYTLTAAIRPPMTMTMTVMTCSSVLPKLPEPPGVRASNPPSPPCTLYAPHEARGSVGMMSYAMGKRHSAAGYVCPCAA